MKLKTFQYSEKVMFQLMRFLNLKNGVLSNRNFDMDLAIVQQIHSIRYSESQFHTSLPSNI